MKSIVFAALLAASVAAGQYLEETIWLPDSLSGVDEASLLLHNHGNNTVYVAGRSGGVLVFDGVTGRKIARLPITGSADAMCYNWRENKVYCASAESDSVYVVDAAANRVIAGLNIGGVGGAPSTLCYNPTVNKVYCGSEALRQVTVIDGHADTIMGSEVLWRGVKAMVCAPDLNKLFCGLSYSDTDAVAVIDCIGDTLIGAIRAVEVRVDEMVYSPINRKLYFNDHGWESVIIVDAVRDSVRRWQFVEGSPEQLCLNTHNGKVYVGNGSSDSLYVICGSGDSLVARIDLGSRDHADVVYDSVDRLVYCSMQETDTLLAIDGDGDSIIGAVLVGDEPAGLCYNPLSGLVYSANSGGNDVSAVDAASQTLVQTIGRFWFSPTALAYCSEQDKVYCTGTSEQSAMVIDASTNRVITDLNLGPYAGTLLCLPGVPKVYCGRSRYEGAALWAIDAEEDTVLAEIPVGTGPHALAFRPGGPGEAKVYCANDGSESVTVIDAETDSVVATVDVEGDNPFAVVYGQDVDAIFVQCEDVACLSKIDCTVDTVVSYHFLPGTAYALMYLEGRRLLCVANESPYDLWVLDAVDLSQVRVYQLGDEATSLAYCHREHKVYYAGWSGSLYAINMTSGQVVSIPTSRYEKELLYDSLSNRLYCISEYEGTAQVLDCATDSVLCVLQLGERPVAAAWSPFWRRVYVANSDGSSISVIHDSTTVGIAEGFQQTRQTRVTQTVVSGVLYLGAGHDRNPPGDFGLCPKPALIDITGRKVMDLKTGENDVRHLAPGVYFLRSAASGKRSAVRKVVIQR